jgi:hypothetical protein
MERIRLLSRSGIGSHAGALLAAALLLVLAAAPVPAQAQGTINLPAVQHLTLGKSNQLPAGLQVGGAIVNEVGGIDPIPFLIVWVFDQRTGFRQGDTLTMAIPTGVTPAAIHFSTIFRPNSLLVLDTAHKVHEFMLMFDASGTPRLAGTAIHDFAALLGGKTDLGVGTSLGELSGIQPEPFQPWLAIGTSSGNLILATFDSSGAIIPCILPVGDGPIADLATVPQAGTADGAGQFDGFLAEVAEADEQRALGDRRAGGG